jgi:hypothetical protein
MSLGANVESQVMVSEAAWETYDSILVGSPCEKLPYVGRNDPRHVVDSAHVDAYGRADDWFAVLVPYVKNRLASSKLDVNGL